MKVGNEFNQSRRREDLGHQIRAMRVEATKCGGSPNPRRTGVELLPPAASNVPNLPDGGDHTNDDNSLAIPTFLLRGHPDRCIDGNS